LSKAVTLPAMALSFLSTDIGFGNAQGEWLAEPRESLLKFGADIQSLPERAVLGDHPGENSIALRVNECLIQCLIRLQVLLRLGVRQRLRIGDACSSA
jgi:hypothetical protein